jgi:hypothetical protein
MQNGQIEGKVITNFKNPLERLLTKKRFILNVSVVSKILGVQILTKRIMCMRKKLWKIWV